MVFKASGHFEMTRKVRLQDTAMNRQRYGISCTEAW